MTKDYGLDNIRQSGIIADVSAIELQHSVAVDTDDDSKYGHWISSYERFLIIGNEVGLINWVTSRIDWGYEQSVHGKYIKICQ